MRCLFIILFFLAEVITLPSNYYADIDAVRHKRDRWAENLHNAIEEFYNRLPLTSQPGKRGHVDFTRVGHEAFSGALGPLGPRCTQLETFGTGDEGKRACGLSQSQNRECTVISVGSDNKYEFERDILQHLANTDRLKTYELCVSDTSFVNNKGWKFDTWTAAMVLAHVSQPAHVKMDIEGFEYSVLESIASSQYAPLQISLELHYATQMPELSWKGRYKTPAEMAIFMAELYRKAGYFVVDRHDNELCPHCSEILLVRFPSASAARASESENDPASDCQVLPHTPTKENWLPSDRSCCAWFKTISIEGGDAVADIPSVLRTAFTMWGAAAEQKQFFNQRYFGSDSLRSNWSYAVVESYISSFLNKPGSISPKQETYPGASKIIQAALDSHPVSDLTGAVFGSESPWLEAILLANGATHITTIEYGKIYSTHPKISALTPFDLKAAAHNGAYSEKFDFVMTYSSLEHSGLGRYGDSLSPFADLEWIERIKCLLKPGGVFYFGVPMSTKDCLVFNAHRVYGPVRLSAVKRGFEELGLHGSLGNDCRVVQPLLVLQKKMARISVETGVKSIVDSTGCKNFVQAAPISAGLGHIFGALIFSYNLAIDFKSTLVVDDGLWNKDSIHGSYPWVNDLFVYNVSTGAVVTSNPTVRRAVAYTRKESGQLLKSSCNILVTAHTGTGNFCSGEYCFRHWPGAYQRAESFIRDHICWLRPEGCRFPTELDLFAGCPDSYIVVAWQLRTGDLQYGSVEYFDTIVKQLSMAMPDGGSNFCHFVFAEHTLCPGRLCGFGGPSAFVIPHTTSVQATLLHLSHADILVCSGSNFCEMASFIGKSNQVSLIPPSHMVDEGSCGLRLIKEIAMQKNGFIESDEIYKLEIALNNLKNN